MFQEPFLKAIFGSASNWPCLSVIVPGDPHVPGHPVTRRQVEAASAQAARALRRVLSPSRADDMEKALAGMVQRLELPLAACGLGLYVSSALQEAVPLFFPVDAAVQVGDRFLVRSLLYRNDYAGPYHVLLLSGKDARLFEGRFAQLAPVAGGQFPVHFEDDYEYSRPARGSSHFGYAVARDVERDKSQMKDLRYRSFLRKVEAALRRQVPGPLPLVVAGAPEDISEYTNSTRRAVAGTVAGSPAHLPLARIAALGWGQYKAFVAHEKSEAVRGLEKLSPRILVAGLSEVWQAVAAGRGARLFVERDFTAPGYWSDEDQYLYSVPPFGRKVCTISDAVDELMHRTIARGGEVIQVENGSLSGYLRVALVTRY